MEATECNFNSRSQKIETARNGGGGGSLVPSCGVEKRGKLMREKKEMQERERAEQEGSQKRKLKGKDFFQSVKMVLSAFSVCSSLFPVFLYLV